MDWRHRAACRDEDPELFFPSGRETSPAYLQGVQEAKAVCQRCPVLAQCLKWAVETGQEGVWGGTSDAERRAIRRDRRQLALAMGVDERELIDA